MTGRLIDGQEGAVAIFFAAVAVAFLFLAGLVYDGGQIIAAHNQATSIARTAARAGTQQIDTDQLRETGSDPQLDPNTAIQAAEAYVTATGHRGAATVADGRLEVTVVVDQPMAILPIGTQQIAGTARSVPLSGIQEAS